MTLPTAPRRWYREPMMWLVIGVPALSVVVGISTLVIAIRAGGLDAATDPVARMAQVQQTDLQADRGALRRGLSASLQRDADRISVQVLGSIDLTQPLRLRFIHPARASDDREVELHWQHDRWSASLSLPESPLWNLSLQPTDGSWRLDGELAAGRPHAVLTPRFSDG